MMPVEALVFAAPIVCALVCMFMMLLDANVPRHNAQEKRLRLFLALTYLVTSLGWLGLVFYAASPRVFTYYHTVFLLTLMLDQVMIYRFVSIITGTGERLRFKRLHLFIPLFITLVSTISDTVVPVEQQTAIIYPGRSGGNFTDTWFKAMYMLTTIVFIVYNTLYPVLNMRNIYRYRRFVVNYSSDAYNKFLGWLATVQALILVTVPLPLAGLLTGIPAISADFFVWSGATLYFANYLILCYNLLNNNYLIVQPEEEANDRPDTKNVIIDRKRFERYMRDKKPFLNSALRVTDLAKELNTNRSYLSAFINREYGMNFNCLINRYRLRELDRLRLLPSGSDNNMDLVLKAGFSSYRSYLRTKNKEDNLILRFGKK